MNEGKAREGQENVLQLGDIEDLPVPIVSSDQKQNTRVLPQREFLVLFS